MISVTVLEALNEVLPDRFFDVPSARSSRRFMQSNESFGASHCKLSRTGLIKSLSGFRGPDQTARRKPLIPRTRNLETRRKSAHQTIIKPGQSSMEIPGQISAEINGLDLLCEHTIFKIRSQHIARYRGRASASPFQVRELLFVGPRHASWLT